MTPTSITLPWPPSVNTYWRRVGARTLISKAGRLYTQSVQASVLIAGCRRRLRGELSVAILAYPPDHRRRDLDNLVKAVFDSLQKAAVYEDDFQIGYFSVRRMSVAKPGKVVVEIAEV